MTEILPHNELLQLKGYRRGQCKECGLIFWRKGVLKNTCGNQSCALVSDEHDKSAFKPTTPKDLLEKFYNFFIKADLKPLGVREALKLRRASTVTRYAQTNFMFAGLMAFERLLALDLTKELREKYGGKLYLQNQFCYRFEDLPQVGKSLRHNTGFPMLGFHLFQSDASSFPENWKGGWLQQMLDFFQSLGFVNGSLIIHEDYWRGGSSNGSSLEFFYEGVEIANIVFIDEGHHSGKRPYRVLDLGIGFERLLKALGFNTPYTSNLLLDHLRSLIVGIKDGALPSKVGIGYAMRKITENIIDETKKTLSELKPELESTADYLKECFDQDFREIIPSLIRISQVEKQRMGL